MTLAAKSKNLVIAMSLCGAALLAFNRWVVPALFDISPLRDGEHTYATNDPRLREVIFAPPAPFAAGIDTNADESQIAVSRDGRWIAYVAGTVGADSELFVAELDGDEVRHPRALVELNTGADEIAPAFGDGALFFASNRAGGAGGFDLYVAPFDGMSFGEPSELRGGINTTADELDPAPHGAELVFVSNRDGNFDLYTARAANDDGSRAITRLEAQSSSLDEREPFVSFDGRALYFASNRALGGANFDLWRCFRDDGVWLAPQLIVGPTTLASERAPRLSHDGFTLLFERVDDPAAEFWRANSIELFRGAQGARGWADLMLLAALLLLALVAALSKRWEELDLLYKCLLASVLLHLLLLWLLRDVRPDAERMELDSKREPTFRVRLEGRRDAQRALAELGGTLEAQRSESAELASPRRTELARSPTENDAPTPMASLERSRSNDAPESERADVKVERTLDAGTLATPSIAAPEEQRTRRSAEPEVASLETPSSVDVERSSHSLDGHVDGPVALKIERTEQLPEAPAVAHLSARSGATHVDPPAQRFAPAEAAPSDAPGENLVGPSIEMRSEARTRLALREREDAPQSALSFEVDRSTSSNVASGSALERGELQRTRSSDERLESNTPTSVALERRTTSDANVPPTYVPGAAAPTRAGGAMQATPDVAAPSENVARRALNVEPTQTNDEHSPLELSRERQAELATGPSERLALHSAATEASIEREVPQPTTALPLDLAPRQRDEPAPSSPPRLTDTPYRSRFGSEKEVALREHGGTRETDRAVANGLRYLAARQARDGAWGSRDEFHTKYRDVRVGKSALALLAFLGAGHTPSSNTEFSAVSARAVEWLLSTQDAATGHFGDSEAYSHGIATYALAECFAITAHPNLREPIERAVAQILRHQAARGDARRIGGWSYYYPDGATYDAWPRTSITSWQVMALESARLGGLAVPDAAFDGAREFLLAAWDDQLGRFRYSHDPARLRSGYPTLPGSTPAALFALALLGEDLASDTWSEAIHFLGACAPRGYRWESEDAFVQRARGNLYFWYYGSLAMLRRGDTPWERWNAALKETLLPAQAGDGSWAPIDVYCAYAGDTDDERIYSTAMCVLSLEVYYRYFTPLLKVK